MKRDSTCMEGEAGPERTERGRLARRLCSGPRCPRSARLCAAGSVRAAGGPSAARRFVVLSLCSRAAPAARVRRPGARSCALPVRLKQNRSFCGVICLYLKLPNPLDHLDELFLVSLITDGTGVMRAPDKAAPSSRDQRCFADTSRLFFPL